MLEIESVQHVAVVVTDLEQATNFYEQVLGLERIPRPNFDFPGAWFAIGNQQLHLLTNDASNTLRGTTDIDTRDGHFALRIASYQAAVTHLSCLGIPFRVNPNSVTGWSQIFICDPDGNVVELNAPVVN